MDRVRSTRQRFALWVTAVTTLITGVMVYRVSGNVPAFDRPLSFRLTEMSKNRTGVDFEHKKGDFAPFFDNVRAFMQTVSAAGCVSDVDRDGLQDLYLVNAATGSKNKLYRNTGNFKFEKPDLPVIEDLNTDGFSTDCVFADVDSDGYDDLLVTAMSHRPWLFMNRPSAGGPLRRTFEDVSESAGLPPYMNAFTAAFVDADNDGDLDLLISGYFAERYDPSDVPGAPYIHHMHVPDSDGAGRMLPSNWANATNGGEKHLLLNDGSGHFVDQDLAKWGLRTEHRFTWDIGTADINRDGYTDIYYANDFGPDELYFNQQGKSFKETVGVYPTDVGRDSFKGMDAEIADIDNDGFPEIYVTNIFHPFLPEGNLLWANRPDPNGNPFMRSFKNVAQELGVQDGGWGWGAKFADLDLDTDMDLVATNGYLSADPKKDYWYRMTRVLGGNGKFISDTKKWPAFGDASLCGYQTSRVFVHEGERFYDRAVDAGIPRSFDGRGVLISDFDMDGRPDVVFIAQGVPTLLMRNEFVSTAAAPEAPSFIGLQLAGDGRKVNMNAVGTRVKISPSAESQGSFPTQYREINAGNGFAAQSMYWITAGLGGYHGKVDVEVWWTDGTIEVTKGLEANQYHHIQFGSAQ